MAVDRLPLTGAPLIKPANFVLPGMPAMDAVHQSMAFTPTPGGPTYQILRTTEFDSYEESAATRAVARLLRAAPVPAPADFDAALRAAPAPLGDDFKGTARKAAKLSIGSGALERFTDLRKLVASLVADAAMINHVPVITKTARSKRVAEEERNVRVKAFLYAASREKDNDFHLMIGRERGKPPEMYMTVEISGLPPATSPAFGPIKSARDAFTAFFGANVPDMTYDFYDPPIPVVVEGSLFFDMSHATGQHPGPPSLKSRIPTIWEIHPVTAITLGGGQ